jgi:hypothetical protein
MITLPVALNAVEFAMLRNRAASVGSAKIGLASNWAVKFGFSRTSWTCMTTFGKAGKSTLPVSSAASK